MTDELRAAAERVRRVKAGEVPHRFYARTIRMSNAQWIRVANADYNDDLALLADAYLAEHDETKLDRDWLCRVLGEPDEADEWEHGEVFLAADEGSPVYVYTNKHRTEGRDLATRADAIAFFRLVRWPVDWAKIVQIWREEQEAAKP